MVEIYEFMQETKSIGCGTKLECDYWTAEGVFDGVSLGRVIGYEPASNDVKRAKAWGIAA